MGILFPKYFSLSFFSITDYSIRFTKRRQLRSASSSTDISTRAWKRYKFIKNVCDGKSIGEAKYISMTKQNQALKTKDESQVKEQFLKVIHSLFLQVSLMCFNYKSVSLNKTICQKQQNTRFFSECITMQWTVLVKYHPFLTTSFVYI